MLTCVMLQLPAAGRVVEELVVSDVPYVPKLVGRTNTGTVMSMRVPPGAHVLQIFTPTAVEVQLLAARLHPKC
jgi:hypothetical protein